MCSADHFHNSTGRHPAFHTFTFGPRPTPTSQQPSGVGQVPTRLWKMRTLRAPKALWFPAPGLLHRLLPCRALFLGVLGKEVKGRCGEMCCPAPASWLPPFGQPCLLCPACGKETRQGGGVLPAAVVMPRSRQVYSSPVQSPCSFMVLGARAASQQGRQQRLWPEMLSGVLCAAEAVAAGSGPRAPGPCLHKPVPAAAAWPRCE